MAAASVLIPLSTINQNGGVLPPSAFKQQSPRHGRSRGASVNGKSAGGRGYRVVEDSDATVAKAVTFVLKRAVPASEVEEDVEEEEENVLVSDADGWVSVADLLSHTKMTDAGISLAHVRHAASSSKARFILRQQQQPGSGSDADRAESWQVRMTDSKRDSASKDPLVLAGEPLTRDSDDLPAYVVYETSYQNYPLVLASGGIKRADGATHVAFAPAAGGADGVETRSGRAGHADVSIWVHLPTAMEQAPELSWQFTTLGKVVTSGEEVPMRLWKRVVARRPDLGVLFEDGEVRKEVPEGLRGKGTRGKAKKGKGHLKQEGRVDSESDSVSDEA